MGKPYRLRAPLWAAMVVFGCQAAPEDAGAPQSQGDAGQALPPTTTGADIAESTAASEVPPEDEVVEPPTPTEGRVEPGDSLSRILSRAGVDAGTAVLVTRVIEPLMDPALLRVGQTFEFELDGDGTLVSFTLRRSATEAVSVLRNATGEYEGRLDKTKVTVSEQVVGGTIRSSLWSAMIEGGYHPSLVDAVVDVFAYDIDFFTSTREGDTFRLLVERHEANGEFVRYGRVIAAEYTGGVASARVYWWQPSASVEGRYVDDEGRGVTRSLLKTPLKYSRISSGFSPARMHPVLHRVKSHRGVDYAAPTGTPVWAAADGTIVFRGRQGGAGNMVVMKHANGLKTLYMHLSKFREGQRVGQKVSAKTVIGYVGMTGLATGPHLHFGVQKHGKYIDPKTVAPARGVGVAARDRSAFAKARERWQARLQALKLPS